MCPWVGASVCLRVHMCVRAWVCPGLRVCMCRHAHVYVCIHIRVYVCVWCISVCAFMHVYICLYYACLYLFIYWASLISQSVKHLPAVQGTRVRSLGREDPLEKEMATHSINLAWSIPWTEEPGRLQSTGLQELDTT